MARDPELTARQRDIVSVARGLLTDEGVEAVTVGRIAAELGIKPPSLYKHFGSKRHIEAALIAEGLKMSAEELLQAGPSLPDIARAYRRFALGNPQLYRLMTERPLPRDLLPKGLEERAATPLLLAAGDPDIARAAWAFAHGMVVLELAGRFPDDADLDAAWDRGIHALSPA